MVSTGNFTTPTELSQPLNSAPRLSFYKNTFDTRSQQTTTPAEIFEAIQSNRYPQVLKARQFNAAGKTDAYDEIKLQLPAFTAAGHFSYRNASELKVYSRRIVLDFDDLSDEVIEELRAFCESLPFVELVFLSPSGEGVKVVCCLSEPIKDIRIDSFHRTAHRQLRFFFAAKGFEIDTGDNLDRLCYISSDPRAFFNPNPHPFEVKEDLTEAGQAASTSANKDIEFLQLSDLSEKYQEAIKELRFKEDGWSETFLPCAFNDHEKDGWDSSHNRMGVSRHQRGFIFHCFKCEEKRTYKTKAPAPVEPPAPDSPITNSAFTHFTREEELLWQEIGKNPNDGWNCNGIPAFTTNYQHLEKMTGEFPDNGQPPELNAQRIWSTDLTACSHCGGIAAHWVDRGDLSIGFYCDNCHKDYSITNYMIDEESRRFNDSVDSDYTGFLGNNPDFQAFGDLYIPGKITLLRVAMGLGKSTETIKSFGMDVPGTAGVLLLPRILTAQHWARRLRYKFGHDAVGLFHQGSGQDNHFIGRIGAVGCFTSLPLIAAQAKEQNFEQLKIAIDEVDFSYQLRSLQPAIARRITKILSEATERTGIVVAGQTVTALALESLSKALEQSEDSVRAFYARAKPVDSVVRFVSCPKREGYTEATRLMNAIQQIRQYLEEGWNVYAYFSDRRDVRTLEAVFQEHNPLVMTAYTKGGRRIESFLQDEKLTDSNLLLATSVAAIGINIHDPNGKNVSVAGLRYGTRPMKEVVQFNGRNRSRTGGAIFISSGQPALPVKPSEAEKTSLYHEALKEFSQRYPDETEIAAREYALSTLVNNQPEDYARYHLEEISGLRLEKEAGRNYADDELNALKETAKHAARVEKEAVQARAKIFLNRGSILTDYEIRRQLNAGQLDGVSALAHERLNDYCQLVGWDGERDELEPVKLSAEQIDAVNGLIDDYADAKKWVKQRRGFFAAKHPRLTELFFSKAKDDAESQEMESTAVDDDRFRGRLLDALIQGLQGKVFTQETLAKRTMAVLTTADKDGKTLLGELKRGALDVAEWRKNRFLYTEADSERIVAWVRPFISEWLPASIEKSHGKDEYALSALDAEKIDWFKLWAKHRHGVGLPDGADESPPPATLPYEKAKQRAKELREEGKTLREAAEEADVSKSEIHRQNDGTHKTGEVRIKEALADGEIHTIQEIVAKANLSLRHFNRIIKTISGISRDNGCIRLDQDICPELANIGPYIIRELGTNVPNVFSDSLTESPPTRTTTALEPDSADVGCLSDQTLDQTTDKTDQTFRHQILILLATGEKPTAAIVSSIDGKRTSIMDELKRLVDAGEIVRVKHGLYDLATRALAPPVDSTDFVGRLVELLPHWDYQQYLGDTPPKLSDILGDVSDDTGARPTEAELRDYLQNPDVIEEGIEEAVLFESGRVISALQGQISTDRKIVIPWLEAWLGIAALFRGGEGEKILAGFRALHRSYEVAREFDSTLQHPVVVPYIRSWQRHFKPL